MAVPIPRISVALSVYDNAPYLAPALDSLLAQTFTDFELLIVNDGSRDESPAIIDAYAARDARIRAIHQPNRGLIASLNRLIDEARAPLIARMDGDDIALPERFAKQVAFLDAHPDHGVVGTRITSIDSAGAVRTDWAIDHPLTAAAVAAALETGPIICHPTAMLRSDVLRAVGGYRAVYRHCEDYDLWLRLSEHTRMANLPDRLLHYRNSPEQVSTRHVLAQHYGAAVARAAHQARRAGCPDPSDDWIELPPSEALDVAFGRPGLGAAIRRELVAGILFDEPSLAGDGRAVVAAHLRDTRDAPGARVGGLWRAVIRVARFGEPVAALRLARTLLLT